MHVSVPDKWRARCHVRRRCSNCIWLASVVLQLLAIQSHLCWTISDPISACCTWEAMTWRGGHQLWKLLWPWWTWQSSCSSVTPWITRQSAQCCPGLGGFKTAWTLTGSQRHSNCATQFCMIAVTRTLVWHIGFMMGPRISQSVYGCVMESNPTLTLGENCTKIPCDVQPWRPQARSTSCTILSPNKKAHYAAHLMSFVFNPSSTVYLQCMCFIFGWPCGQIT